MSLDHASAIFGSQPVTRSGPVRGRSAPGPQIGSGPVRARVARAPGNDPGPGAEYVPLENDSDLKPIFIYIFK